MRMKLALSLPEMKFPSNSGCMRIEISIEFLATAAWALLTAGDAAKEALVNIIEVRGVTKDYALGKTRVQALRGVDLDIAKGDLVSLMGPSGSGKTTLLNIIGCIDRPDSGSVKVAGQELTVLHDKQVTHLRLHRLGFIFQTFNLIPVLTATENVEFPLLLQKQLTRWRNPQAGGAAARRGGPHRVPASPARRAVRRPAAAGGHRPRPGDPPGHRPRRRAHRQPGFGHRRLHPGADGGDEPEGADHLPLLHP